MGRKPSRLSYSKRPKASGLATLAQEANKFRDLRLLRYSWISWKQNISKSSCVLPSLAIPRKWLITGTILRAWNRITAISPSVCGRVCRELHDRQWTRCFARRIFHGFAWIMARRIRLRRLNNSQHKRLLRVVGVAWAKWTFMNQKFRILKTIFSRWFKLSVQKFA